METVVRYGGIPNLDVGDIWGTREYGVFVVTKQEPAKWRGEDRDVYEHVDTWYTIRPATEIEKQLWDRAVAAAGARKQLRKRLGIDSTWIYENGSVRPCHSATCKLDSYDDRWEPPKPINLTPADVAIETEYQLARNVLHVSP